MKVIVAGSRSVKKYSIIEKAILASGFKIDTIISGHAIGVDSLAERYAETNRIDLVIFPANWNKYGKSAGYKRNEKMAEYSDALIAVWDGQSVGTKHMIDIATKKKLKIFVFTLP